MYDVYGGNWPSQLAAQSEAETDGRIEVRVGERAEEEDQHGENAAGRKRVAQKRESVVTAREPLRHDAGAHHGRQQKCRSQRFAKCALCE